jgi:hypothetical protein
VTNNNPRRVDDVELQRIRRGQRCAERVANDRRPVQATGTRATVEPNRWSGLEEMKLRTGDRRIELSERSHVVENPEAPPFGRENQVVVVDLQVRDRHNGHAPLEGLPMAPRVERDPEPVLGSGVQQIFTHRIFPDHARGMVLRERAGEIRPRCAVVARHIEVRRVVVPLMA